MTVSPGSRHCLSGVPLWCWIPGSISPPASTSEAGLAFRGHGHFPELDGFAAPCLVLSRNWEKRKEREMHSTPSAVGRGDGAGNIGSPHPSPECQGNCALGAACPGKRKCKGTSMPKKIMPKGNTQAKSKIGGSRRGEARDKAENFQRDVELLSDPAGNSQRE